MHHSRHAALERELLPRVIVKKVTGTECCATSEVMQFSSMVPAGLVIARDQLHIDWRVIPRVKRDTWVWLMINL